MGAEVLLFGVCGNYRDTIGRNKKGGEIEMTDSVKETSLVGFEQEADEITAIQKRLTPETKALLKETVAYQATDVELAYFIHIAEARGLNPFARQIYFIKRRRKNADGEMVSAPTIQTGIDGFRLIAARTGKYVPSPKPTLFEYKGQLIRATVFGMKLLGDKLVEFSATAKFSEYVANNSMWRKMPETMLEKVAEAKLLRKGFPEELSGLYTSDEMQQASVKVSGVIEAEAGSPGVTTDSMPSSDGNVQSSESDNPMLVTCWEHDVSWTINKFGKRCHRMGDGAWCNFGKVLGPIVKDVVDKALHTDNAGFTTWLKDNYGGKTWSKFSEEEQLGILDTLTAKIKEGKVKGEPEAENISGTEGQDEREPEVQDLGEESGNA